MRRGEDSNSIMVVGGNGLLGSAMVSVISQETDWNVIVSTRTYLADKSGYERWDSGSRQEWKDKILTKRWKPDVIVNAAAMTNVDMCEVEREEAWKTNVDLVEIVAEMARKVNARLIQISTDYVFDGATGPYTETDRPRPVNYYGKTKLAAENACLSSGVDTTIIRTMWLYGTRVKEKRTFVDWVKESLSSDKEVSVVDDEIGNPTFTEDVAYATVKVIEKNIGGILNIAGPDRISRWDWAEKIRSEFELRGKGRMRKIGTKDLKRAATRPLNSGLVTTKAASLLEFKPMSVVKGLQMQRITEERETR
ncbi:MAG: NAD(P)-dependent oxidoreductase [Chlorobi bacterium]|nr:NAD(P)-dependent oxidoreductase [Chlorobiota bacterium]